MVLGLFETGYLYGAAKGFFEYDRGHLSRDVDRMAARLADAMYRGAILALASTTPAADEAPISSPPTGSRTPTVPSTTCARLRAPTALGPACWSADVGGSAWTPRCSNSSTTRVAEAEAAAPLDLDRLSEACEPLRDRVVVTEHLGEVTEHRRGVERVGLEHRLDVGPVAWCDRTWP